MVVNLTVREDGRVVISDERKVMGNGFGGKTRISLLFDLLNWGDGGQNRKKKSAQRKILYLKN